MSNNSLLESEIAELIVETLVLDDIIPNEIDVEAPLFYEGLGLDSIDSLEISMAISSKYGCQLKSDAPNNKEIFFSIRSLADYVIKNKV